MFEDQNEKLRKLFASSPDFSKKSNPPNEKLGFLCQKNKKSDIPLKFISYEIEIIDSLALISLIQNYISLSEKKVELEYFFPILTNACFYEFQAEIDDQIFLGKVKEKNEAKAEYEQNREKGNFVAYSEINKEIQDFMMIDLGNVPSNTPIKIKFSFIQELEVYLNKFWKLLIPATLTPRYTPKISSKEDLNVNFPQINEGYEWNIKIILNSSNEIDFLKSPSHEIIVENLDKIKSKYQINFKNQEIPNKDFTLLFGCQNISETRISLAEIKDDDTPFCARISFLPDFNANSTTDEVFQNFQSNSAKTTFDMNLLTAKGEYIFFIDRSGSMDGERIEMAIDSLKLFIKSLPPDSYFNVIGFGSTFEKLFEESTKNNDNLAKLSLEEISNFKANLNGTEILFPLEEAVKSRKIANYPKNIFILTDGDVYNVSEILSLISQYNESCRFYTIGIGNGCSREIITEGARIGKGKHEFIAENKEMREKIIGLLEDSITPFLSDFKMTYDEKIVKMVAPLPESINYIRKNEEFNCFLFLEKNFREEKVTTLKLEYYDTILKKNIEQNIKISLVDQIIENNYLHKYGIFLLLKRIEKNLFFKKPYDSDIFLAKKDDLDNLCLSLALKHQIITPFTSFICVIRQNDKKAGQFSLPEKIVIPTIFPNNEHAFPEACSLMPCEIVLPPDFNPNYLCLEYLADLPDDEDKDFFGDVPKQFNNCKRKRSDFGEEDILMKKNKKDEDQFFGSLNFSCTNNLQVPSIFNQKLETPFNFTFDENRCDFEGNPLNDKPKSPKIKTVDISILLENQNQEGYWEPSVETSVFFGKNTLDFLESIPEEFQKNNDASNLWMTNLILFFLERFREDEQGVWRLIAKKAEQWIASKGYDYRTTLEKCKQFFYGKLYKPSSTPHLSKKCPSGHELIYINDIKSFVNSNHFFDISLGKKPFYKCSLNPCSENLVEGGVFLCDICGYMLCEECNNEKKLVCNFCEKEENLKFQNYVTQQKTSFCAVCRKINKSAMYSCLKCETYQICLECKAKR